jgi:hypothetical protein
LGNVIARYAAPAGRHYLEKDPAARWRTAVTVMAERPGVPGQPGSGSFKEMLRVVEELDAPDD